MLSFRSTILISIETGIGNLVGFDMICVLLRNDFARSSLLSDHGLARLLSWETGVFVPLKDAKNFRFHSTVFFPNAK